MLSDSKLTANQQSELAEFKDLNPKMVFVDNENYSTDQVTTIGYIDDGKIVRFAASIMSNNERKFRRKVGQYNVAERMRADQFTILPTSIFHQFLKNNGFMSKIDRRNRFNFD